ncbi:MAG: large conductance mechanosensitive channel protein MscL [Microthrixaceae bacterium]
MIEDFKKFINQGNVLDLAVGVVIGAAFGDVINSFVDGILSPIISWVLPGDGLRNATFELAGSTFLYGSVIQAIITFVLIAAAVFFLVVRPYNTWKEKSTADAEVPPTNEERMVALLEQIAQQPR